MYSVTREGNVLRSNWEVIYSVTRNGNVCIEHSLCDVTA